MGSSLKHFFEFIVTLKSIIYKTKGLKTVIFNLVSKVKTFSFLTEI